MGHPRTVEPIVGWRVWNLSDGPDGPVLRPAVSGTEAWPYLHPIEARCSVPRMLTRGLTRHEAPDLQCRCGIYAGCSLAVVARSRPAWPPAPVIGRVALWGRIIEHEGGWRGRFAYPDRLRLVCIVCAWMEPGTGEPIVVHRFGERLYTLCPVHERGVQLQDGRRTRPTGIDPRGLRDRLLDAYAVDLLPEEPLQGLFRRPPAPEVPPYVPTIRVVPPN
jgi:hypothetical protein